MAVFMLRTCNESVNSCKGGIFCVFLAPHQRYLCRLCGVSHSETTIPPYWVLYSTNHEGVPMVGFRANVHDLRPLRSFLSALSPASGRESTYPDCRGRVHACGTVGIERSEDGTLPTRVKRRYAVRVLSCSLRVLPAPVIRQRPCGGRRRPSNGAPAERFIAV